MKTVEVWVLWFIGEGEDPPGVGHERDLPMAVFASESEAIQARQRLDMRDVLDVRPGKLWVD